MNRLEAIQKILDEYIEKSDNPKKYFSHSYGVSNFCALLAAKRGADMEIAAVMGLLHDIYAVKEGTYKNHDILGAKMTEEILRSISSANAFSDKEINIISQAILNHDARERKDGEYDEILKDADIICPYFTNLPNIESINSITKIRLEKTLAELGLFNAPHTILK